jgi:glycosyltransferase involved in cell wall biosynthesis
MKISLDVVICSYRPNLRVLALVLDGMARQTLSRTRWRLSIVNNCPDDDSIAQLVSDQYADLDLQVLSEPATGLIHARLHAIANTKAEVLVFADDDTVLAEDYLQNSLEIAEREATLGAFGGRCRGVYQVKLPKWFVPLQEYIAVRDFGDSPITSDEKCWGKWEPVGAGMVVRREVCQKFADFCALNRDALGLGRSGQNLMAGEDSLLARMAYNLDLHCGYRPELLLDHHIATRRVNFAYMCKILRGHGATFFHLQRLLQESEPFDLSARYILKKMWNRFWKQGRFGIVRTFWEIGYRSEYVNAKNP